MQIIFENYLFMGEKHYELRMKKSLYDKSIYANYKKDIITLFIF